MDVFEIRRRLRELFYYMTALLNCAGEVADLPLCCMHTHMCASVRHSEQQLRVTVLELPVSMTWPVPFIFSLNQLCQGQSFELYHNSPCHFSAKAQIH